MMLSDNQKRLHKSLGNEAFTLVELMVVLAVIGILAGIGISLVYGAKKSAYNAIAKHDLKSFAKSEELYFFDNNQFLGNPGQTTRNDAGSSDFVLNDFVPSEGISITIISGNPSSPYDPTNPYIVQAWHISNPGNKFEYNFFTKQITKK